ncbi:MAG: beta-agarase [Verrucomicrobia bacterium]|nr:beta-agarase [Verrucomicrobiota bacterium]
MRKDFLNLVRRRPHDSATRDSANHPGGGKAWQNDGWQNHGEDGSARTFGLALAFALLSAACSASAAELTLFDFERGFDSSKVNTTDATVSAAKSGRGSALRVATGHSQPWPGVTLVAPKGQWNLSKFGHVALSVRNTGTESVMVNCRIDNPGADGTKDCVTGSVSVEPGDTKELRVPLKRTSDDKLGGRLFGMRGYPVTWGGLGTVNPTNITQLLIFVNKPSADHVFEVDDIRAGGSWTPPTAWSHDAEPFFPLIDTFGQYRHKDWPGKVHSLTELQQRRETEAKELAAQLGPRDWNQYGGWAAGPQLKATGFFRVEKHAGKWWLVDPEGRLFWSHGIDCVRMFDSTPVEERASWFENFPGDQLEFAEFIVPRAFALKGHYAGRSPKCFSFAGANLKRKYGADWKQAVPDVIHRRLRSWALNTIANWSDEGVRLLRRTPYTDAISSRDTKNIEGSEGYWGKFPDVFDASFRESLRRSMAAKRDKSAGDPWCLGYFSDNEMSWGDETSLAEAALRSPPEQAAKREFLADLRTKYGDIAKLNEAWSTPHASWDALLASREAPDRKKAWADLTAFYTKAAETYFRTVREVIKEAAPNQLYLGCRFAWVNARAAAASTKFCDVVSYNLYRRSVADFVFNGGADVPLILGEFHFGALDRGMFHTGLVPVESQAARAAAYADYVRGALRHPQFVGSHWFQYQDQPTTGRVYDEENYQIGFVDIADTPYAETIAASRGVAAELYQLRMKQ